ncbi:hypothetical protein ACFWNK_09965 [Streptomyces sp. NPDC058417]|uniref:hypothetical protein n=1 Tax=unclassified Streptomyces TaxID=2593676 RepID=UPI0036685ACB
MTADRVYPEPVRDEQYRHDVDGRVGWAHVRVWRTTGTAAPAPVVVVLSGLVGGATLERLIPQLRTELPGEEPEFWYHEPSDWRAIGYYAVLTVASDGSVTETIAPGDVLSRRLGPSFYATEDPDDDTPGAG